MPDWAEGDKAYEAYFEASKVASFTPQETIKYDKDMMTERDRINSINYARQEGREEGLMEGELKKQHEIASALKAKGVDVRTISVCTGLSLDEVAKL